MSHQEYDAVLYSLGQIKMMKSYCKGMPFIDKMNYRALYFLVWEIIRK